MSAKDFITDSMWKLITVIIVITTAFSGYWFMQVNRALDDVIDVKSDIRVINEDIDDIEKNQDKMVNMLEAISKDMDNRIDNLEEKRGKK